MVQVSTGALRVRWAKAHDDARITSMAFDLNFRRLITGCENGSVKVVMQPYIHLWLHLLRAWDIHVERDSSSAAGLSPVSLRALGTEEFATYAEPDTADSPAMGSQLIGFLQQAAALYALLCLLILLVHVRMLADWRSCFTIISNSLSVSATISDIQDAVAADLELLKW